MNGAIIPHLWFDSEAQQAARFYVSLFGDGSILNVSRYGKAGAEVSGKPEGSVVTVTFTIAGMTITAINGGPQFQFTPAISLFVTCPQASEVDRLYDALSGDGSVLMPLGSWPFSERYAWVNDRYGVSWQLFKGDGGPSIAPCLMFTGEQYGRAMEAISFYGAVFGPSAVENVSWYEPSEGEREGTVKHAECTIGTTRFMMMDSGYDHGFGFTPAVSFMVGCSDQYRIDRLWSLLSAQPQAEACGWLQDKFGISWQIVPEELGQIMSVDDPVKAENVMKTMYAMKKLDIAALRLAAV